MGTTNPVTIWTTRARPTRQVVVGAAVLALHLALALPAATHAAGTGSVAGGAGAGATRPATRPAEGAPLRVHIISGSKEYASEPSLKKFKEELERRYHVTVTASWGRDGG